METERSKFVKDGFIKINPLITMEEVDALRIIYDKLLQDKVKTAHLRSDLAGADNSADRKVERITQIMRPSTIAHELIKSSAYKKAEQWAKDLLGQDMELNFDMMINKAPRALILNFRPKKMIEFEREQGVDHTGERKQRN